MDLVDIANIQRILDSELELKEKIREHVEGLDQKMRSTTGFLNKIHSTPSDAVPALLEAAKLFLHPCQESFEALACIVPEYQLWRWNHMWTNSLRNAVFAAALIEYLSSHTLISLPRVAETIGIREEWKDRVTLSAEDYLHGVISLINELARLTVNSVTLGDFEQPIAISIFVKNLFSGFVLLNLKNDSLRRRFDSIKYDIKKIEEVVYDVSIRKLASPLASDSKDTVTS